MFRSKSVHPNAKECGGVWVEPPTQRFYLLIGLSCEDFRGHYNCLVGIQMHNKLLWVIRRMVIRSMLTGNSTVSDAATNIAESLGY